MKPIDVNNKISCELTGFRTNLYSLFDGDNDTWYAVKFVTQSMESSLAITSEIDRIINREIAETLFRTTRDETY